MGRYSKSKSLQALVIEEQKPQENRGRKQDYEKKQKLRGHAVCEKKTNRERTQKTEERETRDRDKETEKGQKERETKRWTHT